jgi:hypothetical protein
MANYTKERPQWPRTRRWPRGIGPSILHLVRTYSNLLRVLDLGPKGDYRAQDPIKGDVAPNKEEQATCHNYLEALPT